MGDEARYIHSSLYSFEDERARSAVLDAFHRTVNNSAARCWYNPARHEFQLVCPSYLGSAADEALWRAISTFIDAESAAAEQEEREPLDQRFSESKFDSLGAFADEEEDNGVEVTAVEGSRVTHLIIAADSEGKLIQSFRMFHLPDRLLKRSLAPVSEAALQIFSSSITCRAVREDRSTGYTFNGRTGVGEKIKACDEHELELAPFKPKHDGRHLLDNMADERPKTWNYMGRPPTVEQWRMGVGQITTQGDMLGVDTKPEMPKHAKKLLAETETHMAGRPRVPKGVSLLPEEEDDFEPDSNPSTLRRSFSALMAPNSDSGTMSESSSDEETECQPGFQDLLGGKISQTRRQPKRYVSDDLVDLFQPAPAIAHQPLAIAIDGLPIQQSTGNMSPPTVTATQAVSQAEGGQAFPTFGQVYAKVDGIGLTASAASTAEWQDKHHNRRGSKNKSLPITAKSPMRRSHQTQTLELSSSAGNIASSFPSRSRSEVFNPSFKASKQTSLASQVARRMPLNQKPNGEWQVGAVPAQVSRGGGFNGTIETTSKTASVPPHSAWRTAHLKAAALSSLAAEQTQNLVDDSEHLLHVLDSAEPYSEMSLGTVLKPTQDIPQNTSRESKDGEDQLVEKHHVFPADFGIKKQTMRQKARKKHKHKNLFKSTGKAAPVKAMLESPDPPPKSKPKKDHPLPRLTGLQRERRDARTQAASSSDEASPARSQSIWDASHPFGRQLQHAVSGPVDMSTDEHVDSEDGEDDEDTRTPSETSQQPLKLVAQIGLLLTRGSQELFSDSVCSPEALHAKLNGAKKPLSTFISSRLTSSSGDANYLIELGGKVPKTSVDAFYEIIIKTAVSKLLKVTIPASRNIAHSTAVSGTLVSQAYLHYPTHVWDGHFALVQLGGHSDPDTAKAVDAFVTSMHTDGSVPSFRAQIPSSAFTVEHVHAKQTVTQDHDGLIYRVTKVQDLRLEALDGTRHNWRAVADHAKSMIADQRLWWEAGFETFDLSRAEEMQARLDRIVCNADGVGLENDGPFDLTEESQETGDAEGEEGVQDAVGWFW